MIIVRNLTQSIKTVVLMKGMILHSYTEICACVLSPDDCIEHPCCVRYIAVFAANADWPIMADCVPPGKHYPRVAHEQANYASAVNVTVGSSWLLQKSFFFLLSGEGDFSKGPTDLR